jgi:hypothetical protein
MIDLRAVSVAAAVLAAAGCGVDTPDLNPPDCVSTCGLRLYASGRTPEPADCDAFDRAERLALTAYAKHVSGFDLATSCGNLHGWRVYIVPAAKRSGTSQSYDNPYVAGQRITGQTFCEWGYADVNTLDWYGTSSLFHEMGHMIDRCADDHESWEPRGLFAAIDEAKRMGNAAVAP